MELKNVLETIKEMIRNVVEGQDKINNNTNKALLLINERLENLEKRVNKLAIDEMMKKIEK